MDRRYKKKMVGYWQREKKRSIRALDKLNIAGWFDYWHLHIDWYEKGNRFPENRRNVAISTFEILLFAQEKFESRAIPFQIWATICPNTADNAVYIHTVNENGTPFPHGFEGVTWGVDPPVELDGVINSPAYKLGKVVYDSGPVYIITMSA